MREPGAPPVYEQRRPKLSTLQHVVREDLNILYAAVEGGVPRSTAAGWLRAGTQNVITLDVLELRS